MGRRRRGTVIVLRYIHAYRDRYGKLRHYLRRPGQKKIALPGEPGSPEFMAAYQAGMAMRRKPIGEGRHAPDSTARWVSLYLESAAFAALAPDTRRTRRNLLERFRVKNGDRRATMLRSEDIERFVGKLSPVVARKWTVGAGCLLVMARARAARASRERTLWLVQETLADREAA